MTFARGLPIRVPLAFAFFIPAFLPDRWLCGGKACVFGPRRRT
jgi:hypothetical protein